MRVLLHHDTAVYAGFVSCSNLSLILLRKTICIGHVSRFTCAQPLHPVLIRNRINKLRLVSTGRNGGFDSPNWAISGRRDAPFCLEPILTSQPFRQWSATDSYLCPPEHRTEEMNLGDKASLWMALRLPFYCDLAIDCPQQSPFRRKFLRLDQLGWTQIVAAVVHPRMRIPPYGFRCVPQEVRPTQLAFDKDRARARSPANYVGILVRWCSKFVEHHRTLSAQPPDTQGN